MKKVAIVGVEGSGKTVMLAGLGEFYSYPDEKGYFLAPKNFGTASYVMDVVARMRKGEWPSATAEDVMRGLDWTIKRNRGEGQKPKVVGELSCLDFAGEVYRAAFIKSDAKKEVDSDLSKQIKELRTYIWMADAILVLINLRDVIANGFRDRRVQEAMWITNAILNDVLGNDATSGPRAAIVLSQADSYADTIRACGGEKEVLRHYLPHVYNNYSWLDVFSVSSVDRTVPDNDGNQVPAKDFTMTGLKPIMDWVLKDGLQGDDESARHKEFKHKEFEVSSSPETNTRTESDDTSNESNESSSRAAFRRVSGRRDEISTGMDSEFTLGCIVILVAIGVVGILCLMCYLDPSIDPSKWIWNAVCWVIGTIFEVIWWIIKLPFLILGWIFS